MAKTIKNKKEDEPIVEPVAEKPVKRPDPIYRVAKGKAVSCKKGMLDAGTRIEKAAWVGGEEALVALIEKGVVEVLR